MLKLVDIEKTYTSANAITKALNGVSFEVAEGQIMALLARNGAGKSTLISIIAGLLSADHGEIWINGEKRKGKKLDQRSQRLIGIAGQDTGIYPELSILENLRFFADLYGVPRREHNTRIQEVAALLGLTELLQRRGNQLSGGEKRRLHTGAALIHRPKLLLLDEPTVGADPHARNEILNTVKTLAARGTAVIYTSHYFPEIEALDADITVMDKGQLLAQGSRDSLLERYGQQAITIEFSEAVAIEAATVVRPTQSGEVKSPYVLQLQQTDSLRIPQLLSLLEQWADKIINLSSHSADLEQVFIKLTQSP